MNLKQIVQDYFTFSRNERKGITILLVIIFLLAVANKIIFYFETPGEIDAQLLNAGFDSKGANPDSHPGKGSLFSFNPNTVDTPTLDSLAIPEGIKRNMIRFREKGGHYYKAKDFKKIYGVTDSLYTALEPFIRIEAVNASPAEKGTKKQLFNFDPNQASDSVFLCLGITEKQIQTIRNYQRKGGYFYNREDLFKIYGLTESQKKDLLSYVIIEKKELPKSRVKADQEKIIIEINSTDSVELMKLPGIGTTLSKRIIKYRDLLGGFYTFEQLKEVYGLKEATIDRIHEMITVDPTKVHSVDLNFSDQYELARHPYIGYKMAGQIINFRTRYGKISDPVDLKDSLILSEKEYEKLKPYLEN